MLFSQKLVLAKTSLPSPGGVVRTRLLLKKNYSAALTFYHRSRRRLVIESGWHTVLLGEAGERKLTGRITNPIIRLQERHQGFSGLPH